MAAEPESFKKRKRKKSCGGQSKLLVGERVEVRSEEDGFLGSWYTGTVISSSSRRRHVKYDHLLTDNGDDHLVNIVTVSSTIDGINFSDASQCHNRGHIRPLPPPVKFGKCSLPYGLCVDVYYNEAWWEGVIFDLDDGSAERRIFFPDLGDEMTVGIESLRITQDWDEFTETWHPRGTWLFLELIEEHEQESYLAVSVKQIWYDLRGKKGYEKLKDWTSPVRSLWKDLVLEVIDDNVKIDIDHFLRVVGLLRSSCPEQAEDDQDLDYHPPAVNSPRTESLVIKPVYNPQAVVDWCMLGVDENKKFNLKKTDMVLKARQHLSALGWVFKYVIGSNSKRNVYHFSPEGKSYFSLRSACKACLDRVIGSEICASTSKTTENIIVSDEAEDQLASGKQSYAVSITDFNKSVIPSRALSKNLSTSSCMPQKTKLKMKRKTNSSCLVAIWANSNGTDLPKFKLEDELEDTSHTYVLRSRKRVKQLDIPSSSNQNPRTLLSWLIDNNVVLPRAKVIYSSRKKRHPKAEGQITRDGIKCKCCGKVYTLSGFEDHAGSTDGNPASHIFLEDGRSLLDCQLEVLNNGNERNFTGEPHDRLKGNLLRSENDYKCSVCHYGGELILCDRCPSSFHRNCVGLEDVPDGDWFCPSCCCGICGNSNSREEDDVVDGGVLICHQCELKYHRGCIENGVTDKFGTHAKENWFCSKKCEEIFMGLQKLLRKPIQVGVPNLTWTLVKSSQHDMCKLEATDIETLSKLNIAHRVMHECFEPVHEPYSSGDLVEDVLFSRGSVLNRLNFRGFYTVLLERNGELVSVATVRVFGEKAAEIPLVGTRFQYRRLGMCRILMNELEKRLMEIGVERLILPAIPSVLKTWTTSFGFSTMTTSERVQLVDYTFLNFLDTTMCQKLLPKRPSAELKLSRGSQPGLQNNVRESGDNNGLAGSSPVSEVSPADQIEESVTEEQRLPVVATKNDITGSESSVHTVVMVNQPTCHESEPQQTKINIECSLVDADFDETRTSRGSDVNCYKRRKISAKRN